MLKVSRVILAAIVIIMAGYGLLTENQWLQPYNLVNAKSPEPKEIKLYGEDWYVTPEEIIWDIIFPAIDKRVIKEYGGKEDLTFGWKKQRIVNIVYNNNYSYDLSIRIQVPDNNNIRIKYTEDLVKVRVSPSCDSPKNWM